ncbi:uncharacterized protein [Dermacentor albipictus]|uniref:uncharacterized protein n=1 Tax=Dermacentor albipictus TaxID=60249 RepID=UPI0038FC6D3B
MDFLREHGAVINVRELVVTFSMSTDYVDLAEQQRPRLRIADDDVTLPRRSCALVPVICDNLNAGTGVAEHINALVLSQGVSITRAVIDVHDGRAELLLTNFTRERRHIVRGTAVAYFDELTSIQDCLSVEHATATMAMPAPVVDISPTLSPVERNSLLELIDEFKSCFSSTSRVGQTPLTKHRILTEADARPIWQNPYCVAPKECEAIQTQVKTMLENGAIRPSKSPWASPVVLVKKKDGSLRFCVYY